MGIPRAASLLLAFTVATSSPSLSPMEVDPRRSSSASVIWQVRRTRRRISLTQARAIALTTFETARARLMQERLAESAFIWTLLEDEGV